MLACCRVRGSRLQLPACVRAGQSAWVSLVMMVDEAPTFSPPQVMMAPAAQRERPHTLPPIIGW